MKKKWHCITANLLLFSSSSIFALDVYSIQDNTLRIRNVDLGADTYTDVKIKVGNILNISSGLPNKINDQYISESNTLKISKVYVDGKSYSNVDINVGEIIQVGGMTSRHSILPSGLTFEEFKTQAISFWNESPSYIESTLYEQKLAKMTTSTTCYGFGTDDLIPPTPLIKSWSNANQLGSFYQLRSNGFDGYRPYVSAPVPFKQVTINANIYAQNDPRVTQLRTYLEGMLQYINSNNFDQRYLTTIKNFLLSYANANALSEGLYTNWSDVITENTPVHFEIMPLTLQLIHAFNLSYSTMSVQERQVIGSWLNTLVTTTIKSSWSNNKQDNKAYYRTQIALAWGILIGDPNLIRNAVLMYKNAIYEMRSDGSFINESSRGGSANLYQSQALDSLLSVAISLEENLNFPALEFQVNNKSIWIAAGRVLDAYENQVKIASQYGKSCEGSFGSVTTPDSRWGYPQSFSFLRVGLYRSDYPKVTERIKAFNWNLSAPYVAEREGLDLTLLIAR